MELEYQTDRKKHKINPSNSCLACRSKLQLLSPHSPGRPEWSHILNVSALSHDIGAKKVGGRWGGVIQPGRRNEGDAGHSQSWVANRLTSKPCLDRTGKSLNRKSACYEPVGGRSTVRRGTFEETRGCLSGQNPVDEQPFSCDQATAARGWFR